MTTREEAVEYFRELGYVAHLRDWALGKSVVVPFGEKELAGEIILYPQVLWLFPCNQGWGVLYRLDESKFATLDEAIASAKRFIDEYEGFNSKTVREKK